MHQENTIINAAEEKEEMFIIFPEESCELGMLTLRAAVLLTLSFTSESLGELGKYKDLRISKNQDLTTETRKPYFIGNSDAAALRPCI